MGGVGVGLAALSGAHWSKGPRSPAEASLLRALPLNLIGITAHYAGSVPIPRPLRTSIFKAYCAAVGCDVTEVEGNLDSFRSLSHFFSRKLRLESRPIDKEATLVAPCDGTVFEAGPVGAYGAIDVKGIKYRIRDIFGAGEREPLAVSSVAVADRTESGLRLWYVVIHIGPGQCHQFASPGNWKVIERRHIEGHLLWMNPEIHGLYTENERIAMLGNWRYGLFAMTAVGAAGRGSIAMDLEEKQFRPKFRPNLNKVSTSKYPRPTEMQSGQPLGAFKLGSAVVLVFEAPEQPFKLHVKGGDEVKLGQPLATLDIAKLDTELAARKISESGAGTRTVDKENSARARFRRAW